MTIQDNLLLTPYKCWQASYDTKLRLPLFMSLVPAGSPSPVDGQVDRKLDLKIYLSPTAQRPTTYAYPATQ